MKKVLEKIVSALFAGVVFFSLFSCVKSRETFEGEKVLNLVMAEVNHENSISGKFDAAFKEKVEELSGGKIRIALHYSGILGDSSKVMELIKNPGSPIHLARVSGSLESYGGKMSRIILMPYVFSSTEHFWKFAESDLAREILDEPYKAGLGVKGIAFGEEGFRHFFATIPVKSIYDMRDINVRVSNSRTMEEIVECLGANPVVVQYTDLFSKFHSGCVNAAEQPMMNYYSSGFYKVAPYMILDGHTIGPMQIVISSFVWDSLSENQKAVLDEAGKYASKICRAIQEDIEQDVMRKLADEGVVFFEVKDKTPWKETCMEIINDYEYPEIYQKILDMDRQ